MNDSNTLNVNETTSYLKAKRAQLFFIPLVVSIFVAAITLTIPNRFLSEATLYPMIESNMPAGATLGGLAALAGVNMRMNGGADKAALALEILDSKEYIGRFIENHQIKVELFAIEKWDAKRKEALIDPDIYDEKSKKWVRNVSEPYQIEPSIQEAVEKFKDSFKIASDKLSGTVKISFESRSPDFSKKVLDLIIIDLNSYIRDIDVNDIAKNIVFLKEKVNSAESSELKVNLYKLLEEQIKREMLTKNAENYVFRVIDKPVSPELKNGPKRAIIVIVFYILSLFLTILFFAVKGIKNNNAH